MAFILWMVESRWKRRCFSVQNGRGRAGSHEEKANVLEEGDDAAFFCASAVGPFVDLVGGRADEGEQCELPRKEAEPPAEGEQGEAHEKQSHELCHQLRRVKYRG